MHSQCLSKFTKSLLIYSLKKFLEETLIAIVIKKDVLSGYKLTWSSRYYMVECDGKPNEN